MAEATDKNYLQLMRDLLQLRRSRASSTVPTDYADLDREILEHEAEIRKRDRHTR